LGQNWPLSYPLLHGCLSHIRRFYASIIFKSISIELYVHMAIPEVILLIVILK